MELFEQGKVKLYRGDCMELMATYPDGYFDLAIVDPPYGLGDKLTTGGCKGGMGSMRKSFKDLEAKTWDVAPNEAYFIELLRVSKNQVIWGGNYFLDHLGSTRCMLIWDKMNGTNPMADAEIAWTSFDKSVRMFKMHHFSSGYDDKIHPTQKPTKLYKWILDKYAKCKTCNGEGGYYEDVVCDGGSKMYQACDDCDGSPKILDTHLGSGSSAIAAHYFGCEFTGIEIDEDYYKAAVKRFIENTKQQDLFKRA